MVTVHVQMTCPKLTTSYHLSVNIISLWAKVIILKYLSQHWGTESLVWGLQRLCDGRMWGHWCQHHWSATQLLEPPNISDLCVSSYLVIVNWKMFSMLQFYSEFYSLNNFKNRYFWQYWWFHVKQVPSSQVHINVEPIVVMDGLCHQHGYLLSELH